MSRYCPRPCVPLDGLPRWEVWDRIDQAPVTTYTAINAEEIARKDAALRNENAGSAKEGAA